ncbi:MAG: element excision factor XisH family protein [Spirulinaceae cyanobacterium]
MAAKDLFHLIVRNALEKDAWIITEDPLYLRVSPKVGMLVDLAAHQIINAQQAERKIAVEVKSFVGLSNLHQFHLALGQFLNYRLALEQLEPDRTLYLAIPTDVYQEFFSDSFIQA